MASREERILNMTSRANTRCNIMLRAINTLARERNQAIRSLPSDAQTPLLGHEEFNNEDYTIEDFYAYDYEDETLVNLADMLSLMVTYVQNDIEVLEEVAADIKHNYSPATEEEDHYTLQQISRVIDDLNNSLASASSSQGSMLASLKLMETSNSSLSEGDRDKFFNILEEFGGD